MQEPFVYFTTATIPQNSTKPLLVSTFVVSNPGNIFPTSTIVKVVYDKKRMVNI